MGLAGRLSGLRAGGVGAGAGAAGAGAGTGCVSTSTAVGGTTAGCSLRGGRASLRRSSRPLSRRSSPPSSTCRLSPRRSSARSVVGRSKTRSAGRSMLRSSRRSSVLRSSILRSGGRTASPPLSVRSSRLSTRPSSPRTALAAGPPEVALPAGTSPRRMASVRRVISSRCRTSACWARSRCWLDISRLCVLVTLSSRRLSVRLAAALLSVVAGIEIGRASCRERV